MMKQNEKRRKTGRPTKYTPSIVARICAMISRGLNYSQAADAAGIHRDTMAEWQATNSDFSDALEGAKARGIDRRLARIEHAGKKGCWQSDAWWLERVYPEQFGRKNPANQTGEAVANPVSVSPQVHLYLPEKQPIETCSGMPSKPQS